MLVSKIDPGKPIWALYGPRAWGPFEIHMVGVTHALLHVPSDQRLWVNAERARPHQKGRVIEAFPCSCLTQEPADVKAWNDLNEPKVGDLVSIKRRKREWLPSQRSPVVRDETFEGVVYNDTGHQVQVMSASEEDRTRDWGHFTKDSCFVIVKGGGQ